jgi:predicted transglutaminase-like cysteine proteinase
MLRTICAVVALVVNMSASAEPLYTKWSNVVHEMRADHVDIAHCVVGISSCREIDRQYLALTEMARGADSVASLRELNQTIDGLVTYKSDGEIDTWQRPLVTLEEGHGDCEDYAILKYALLWDGGFPPENLRLKISRGHAVLAVKIDDQWRVMGNHQSGLPLLTDYEAVKPTVATFAFEGVPN